MGTTSEIEWTDATWQVTRGCERVSPGCGGHAHEGGCYAERMAWRLQHNPRHPLFDLGVAKMTPQGPRWTGKVLTAPDQLAVPLGWKKPRRVFVNSMSDLFHENVPDGFIAAVFGVMAACPQHVFQVLTKRPERMAKWFKWVASRPATGMAAGDPEELLTECVVYDGDDVLRDQGIYLPRPLHWPLPNVWLGCSVEDQRRADERIPHLLRVPAAVRFLSVEPMLGPVDLTALRGETCDVCGGTVTYDAFDATATCDCCIEGGEPVAWESLDWLIVGGESGPGARSFDLAWARSLIGQCRAARVACFVKQFGARPTASGEHATTVDLGLIADKKGGDPAEWPEDLRIREFPDGR